MRPKESQTGEPWRWEEAEGKRRESHQPFEEGTRDEASKSHQRHHQRARVEKEDSETAQMAAEIINKKIRNKTPTKVAAVVVGWVVSGTENPAYTMV